MLSYIGLNSEQNYQSIMKKNVEVTDFSKFIKTGSGIPRKGIGISPLLSPFWFCVVAFILISFSLSLYLVIIMCA